MEQLLTPRDRLFLLERGIKPEGATDFRQPISEQTKKFVEQALASVPEGKNGVLMVIADEHGPRAHVAARFGDHFKVAASGGVMWPEEDRTEAKRMFGTVAIMGEW